MGRNQAKKQRATRLRKEEEKETEETRRTAKNQAAVRVQTSCTVREKEKLVAGNRPTNLASFGHFTPVEKNTRLVIMLAGEKRERREKEAAGYGKKS